ncbi:MAG: aldehyde dehydrogenase family protein [Trueperaceae bacterium]|nr:aldehyde dehydrogenase family protein [Trueperaceae bacterium]
MTVKAIFETLEYGPAPESDDVARAWLARHGARFGHFVAGTWRASDGGETFATIDPATGATLAHLAQGTVGDVDAAVAAARAALPGWHAIGPHGRARYLYALARHVQKHARLLAVLESLDNGKSIRETRDLDVPLVARHLYHHAGWAQLLDTEFPDHVAAGVCGQIIPWNFPLLMLAWKVAPALAAGCTVVLKPAEFTPLSALAFAELATAIGLPKGVLNVVTGDGRTGQAIVDHDDVDKLAFTGSTEVGRGIRERSAGSGKKLSLELGGKSPFLVFDDADLDGAIEGVVDAIWFNQGQVCCAGSRLLLHEPIAEAFIRKLKARMETLRMGHPLDKAIDMGTMIAPVQLQKVQALVQRGIDEGVSCHQPSWAVPADGLFYPPTLFTDVDPASTLAQVEIFGPVLVSTTFRTPAEGVEIANHTPFGLAASVWSESLSLALDVAPKLKAGVVWVNATNLFDAAAGFGGYRESGFGREGGREGMHEYLVPAWEHDAEPYDDSDFAAIASAAELGDALYDHADDASDAPAAGPGIDRTPKLYVGGKGARPDSGYSYPVRAPDGRHLGEAGLGNRKDVRNAVEAARKAESWSGTSGHLRAQILYYLGENLEARAREFGERLRALTGSTDDDARAEVERSVARLFTYAAHADKFDGAVHDVPIRGVALAMHEPWGVMALSCPDEAPLLAFVSLVAPAVAMGNRVVVTPSPRRPLAATDLYQVLDTSDVPGGVINVLSGDRDELARTLAAHEEVACHWYVGSAEGSAAVERASAGNLKATWVNHGRRRDWHDPRQGEGRTYLRRAVQVKNVWIPYGE